MSVIQLTDHLSANDQLRKSGWFKTGCSTMRGGYDGYCKFPLITRRVRFATLITLLSFRKVQETSNSIKYLSTICMTKYDAKNKEFCILATTKYRRRMAMGPVVYQDLKPGVWWHIEPQSLGEVELKIACGILIDDNIWAAIPLKASGLSAAHENLNC